ncbi:putative membrane protein [Leadbettera azotonutricia ZAS-9]|uniref:Putative membrane protein n=2 Tax=Leadbettera azotonutricia TaxID=150829 RepID=F5YDZ5_LEAAZ|nr:putative membrane protein [Leadbettera azotonutricia ZAS-9]
MLVSLIHAIAIFFRKEQLRRITKIFIIPPLLAYYLTGTDAISILPALALLLGWTGDILLLKLNDRLFFKLGLGAFLLGHIAYIITFVTVTGSIHFPALIISAIIAVPYGIAAFRLIHPEKELIIPVIVYMAILETMNIIGLQLFLSRMDLYGFLIFAGCLCFMVSDAILAYFTFRTLPRYGAILIMVFYALAQAGIIIGLMG